MLNLKYFCDIGQIHCLYNDNPKPTILSSLRIIFGSCKQICVDCKYSLSNDIGENFLSQEVSYSVLWLQCAQHEIMIHDRTSNMCICHIPLQGHTQDQN